MAPKVKCRSIKVNKIIRFLSLALALLLVITVFAGCCKNLIIKKTADVKDTGPDTVSVDESTIDEYATEVDFETGEVIKKPKDSNNNSSSGSTAQEGNGSENNESGNKDNSSSTESNTSSDSSDTVKDGDGMDNTGNWTPWK
ncbi:MAG: hypothetical protein MJ091_04140 [Clostridia bacterium]|nr:hypothetical protein [Clostridia bacterium]